MASLLEQLSNHLNQVTRVSNPRFHSSLPGKHRLLSNQMFPQSSSTPNRTPQLTPRSINPPDRHRTSSNHLPPTHHRLFHPSALLPTVTLFHHHPQVNHRNSITLDAARIRPSRKHSSRGLLPTGTTRTTHQYHRLFHMCPRWSVDKGLAHPSQEGAMSARIPCRAFRPRRCMSGMTRSPASPRPRWIDL